MASSINASTSGAGGVITTADNTGILNIQTAGTNAVTVDASQNVGIGTTSPTYKLDTVSATNAIAKFTYSTVSSVMYNSTGSGTAYWGDQNVQNAFGINSASAYVSAWTNNVERMRIDSSGNLQFNSGYGSAATAYGCRAWVNFNGSGTVAIRASGNVSSITDGGVGNYTVNFTTAMPDANYAVSASAIQSWWSTAVGPETNATSSVNIRVTGESAYRDASLIGVSIFR